MEYKPRKQRDLKAERERANERIRERGKVMHQEALRNQEKFHQEHARKQSLKLALEKKRGYSEDLHTPSREAALFRHKMKKGLISRPTKEQAHNAFNQYSKD